MLKKRKPIGYWGNFENLQSELLSFIQANSLDAMPSQTLLVKIGRNDLSLAISRHGGYYEVAEKLGLKLHSNNKPLKYWNDFDN